MQYYAHSSDNSSKSDWEPLQEHLLLVAERAKAFGVKFGAGDLCFLAGVLHDIGKYQNSFQKRLEGSSTKVDHAVCGAREVLTLREYDYISQMIAYAIIGHHSGLADLGADADSEDTGTLLGRLKKKSEDYLYYKNEMPGINENIVFSITPEKERDKFAFQLGLLTRMIYSCLVDADYLETERYYNPKIDRAITSDFNKYEKKLDDRLGKFKPDDSIICLKRNEILSYCKKSAEGEKGIYTLSVPTGGGKTLSSFSFAVKHLLTHKLDRIIFVIPYTSIIEQTADVFKDLVGSDALLEHHCNFVFDDSGDDSQNKLRLASENWDVPVVVTTNVQFLESFFSSKGSKARKLHNAANSVIIFDEVQMLPLKYLSPCLTLIEMLSKHLGSTVLMMSATFPPYQTLMPDARLREIVPKEEKIEQYFQRTVASYIGKKSDEEIISLVKKERQALVIVNSKAHARELSQKYGEDAYHLSTRMIPSHRKEVLKKIRDDLKDSRKRCVVFSTSLIECGVDVDFETVFRSAAGLDSVVQSAGRCNREGKLLTGRVYVFESTSPREIKKGDIKEAQMIALPIMSKSKEDLLSVAAVDEYFEDLLCVRQKQLDNFDILKCFKIMLRKGKPRLMFDFEKCDTAFSVITSDTTPVIVPVDAFAEESLRRLIQFGSRQDARALQRYSVSVYENELLQLKKRNAVKECLPGVFVLTDVRHGYHEKLGLLLPEEAEPKAFVL